ncbi:MAG TPA: hypothetical protein ENI34_01530 [candidate division WOR-3 bacterium]|uniref:Lipoprotein n=1 Tax=candidate division WOR-3 bacterium TaxID=2052148 RepID=A0A9C9EKZ2_UNCW3|nr:hypothetical protein [candidate division WOR-3 bacterium]
MLKYFVLSLVCLCISGAAEEPAEKNDDSPAAILDAPLKEKLLITDSWFSRDKFLHFSTSSALTGITYSFWLKQLKQDENRGKIYSVSLSALLGVGKELYDKKKKGLFSWKDLFWDGVGVAVGYLIFLN